MIYGPLSKPPYTITVYFKDTLDSSIGPFKQSSKTPSTWYTFKTKEEAQKTFKNVTDILYRED